MMKCLAPPILEPFKLQYLNVRCTERLILKELLNIYVCEELPIITVLVANVSDAMKVAVH
ncbi:hypothetical protein DPMN_082885 [Dreissena polymorpha]|uniref:Uncharacterized protein n=1 Tax=Dreissena polymorpha TaxID=45954 RepID=A0A9D3YAU7_DREPO|nr:hypothetical protein DPMN_082885 [Dreissena polymorpha]